MSGKYDIDMERAGAHLLLSELLPAATFSPAPLFDPPLLLFEREDDDDGVPSIPLPLDDLLPAADASSGAVTATTPAIEMPFSFSFACRGW